MSLLRRIGKYLPGKSDCPLVLVVLAVGAGGGAGGGGGTDFGWESIETLVYDGIVSHEGLGM